MRALPQRTPSARLILVMVLSAFLLRLCVIPFFIGDIVDPRREHWDFGREEGRIARSIAADEGFSSPLFGKTGPTAWSAPGYPYLLAGVFRLFGIYSLKSAHAILALNALFSSLVCIPVVFLAWRIFGDSTSRLSGWVWVFFPYAVYFSASRVWGYCLDALMLMLVVWATYEIAERSHFAIWLLYGILWGLAALANPVILSTLPALLVWLAYHRYKSAVPSQGAMATAVIALCLTVFPWFLRNYRAFGHSIPFRGTFWMIFWEGNTGDTSDLYPDWSNPAHNDTEMNQYRQLGEVGYVAEKRRLSFLFLRNYFPLFVCLTLQRIVFTWTGFWNLRPDYLSGEPFAFPNIAVCTLLTLFMVAGIRRAFLVSQYQVIPLLLVLAFYPLVYYVTHPGMDYRHPLDPLITMLGASYVSSLSAARASRQSDR